MTEKNGDLTGKRFGRLLVVGILRREKRGKSSRLIWDCVCDCGVHVGKSRSGLNARQRISKLPLACTECVYSSRHRMPDYERIYRLSIVDASARRGIENSLSIEEFMGLSSMDCFYCGAPPRFVKWLKMGGVHMNGVDRIDSDGKYELCNVVPCCKTCNFMKSQSTAVSFIKQCQQIVQNINKPHHDWMKSEVPT